MIKLKNGSTIKMINLQHEPAYTGGAGGHVLALTPHGEFVTWAVDGEGNTYSGHYFNHDYTAAFKDYMERSGYKSS